MTASTLPVDARTVRPLRPLTFAKGVPTRSVFRRGEMIIDAAGFTLSGVGIRAVGWLTGLGCLGLTLSLLSLLAFTGRATSSVWGVVALVNFGLGIISILAEATLLEIHRVPLEIRIPWSDFVEAQFDPQMRWATLVFYGEPRRVVFGKPPPVTEAPKKKSLIFLPLRAVGPSMLHALRDVLEVHAPHRAVPDASVYEWTPQRKWAALTIVLLFAVGIVALCALAGII